MANRTAWAGGVPEHHAAARQALQVGRADRAPVGARHRRVELVAEDRQHVRPRRAPVLRRERAPRQETSPADLHSFHHCRRSESCSSRGWFTWLLTTPNDALPSTCPGNPNCTRLNRLKNSARNCRPDPLRERRVLHEGQVPVVDPRRAHVRQRPRHVAEGERRGLLERRGVEPSVEPALRRAAQIRRFARSSSAARPRPGIRSSSVSPSHGSAPRSGMSRCLPSPSPKPVSTAGPCSLPRIMLAVAERQIVGRSSSPAAATRRTTRENAPRESC